MIKLLNKILNRFGFELVNKKPDMTLVEASVKFLNQNPKFVSDSECYASAVGYVGDVNYVKERVEGEFPQVSGRTYYQHQVLGKDKTFYNYEGEEYTPHELSEKLKND
jgi:hypothetical protein